MFRRNGASARVIRTDRPDSLPHRYERQSAPRRNPRSPWVITTTLLGRSESFRERSKRAGLDRAISFRLLSRPWFSPSGELVARSVWRVADVCS